MLILFTNKSPFEDTYVVSPIVTKLLELLLPNVILDVLIVNLSEIICFVFKILVQLTFIVVL